jgi:hypothetical protein
MSAVSSFRMLRSLGLHWVELSGDDLPGAYRFPPECRALSLDLFSAHDVESFFQAILSLDTLPIFSSLSLRGARPNEEEDSFGKYLRRAGNDLHHLRFQLDASSFHGTIGALSLVAVICKQTQARHRKRRSSLCESPEPRAGLHSALGHTRHYYQDYELRLFEPSLNCRDCRYVRIVPLPECCLPQGMGTVRSGASQCQARSPFHHIDGHLDGPTGY